MIDSRSRAIIMTLPALERKDTNNQSHSVSDMRDPQYIQFLITLPPSRFPCMILVRTATATSTSKLTSAQPVFRPTAPIPSGSATNLLSREPPLLDEISTIPIRPTGV